jgi:membrane protein YqaA with SNARE-associated domain
MKEFGNWLVGSIATLGPWGLLLVAFGDSAFVPIPQGVDALLITQVIAAPSTAWLAASIAVFGSVAGSLILYHLARRGGRAMLLKRVSPAGMDRLETLTQQYGAAAIIPPMMIPLPLPTKLFVIAAGVFQMRIVPFILAATLGRSVRYFGEAALALKYGEGTPQLLKENAWTAAGLGLTLVAVFFAVNRWSSRKVKEGEI